MEHYKYFLKEPIYVKWHGKMSRVKYVGFEDPPEYYIADNTVYVRCQAKNLEGKLVGIALYLPIVMSIKEFIETLTKDSFSSLAT